MSFKLDFYKDENMRAGFLAAYLDSKNFVQLSIEKDAFYVTKWVKGVLTNGEKKSINNMDITRGKPVKFTVKYDGKDFQIFRNALSIYSGTLDSVTPDSRVGLFVSKGECAFHETAFVLKD